MSQQDSIPPASALDADLDEQSVENAVDQQADKAAEEALQSVKPGEPGKPVKEVNGPKGLEPTRYGDWESNGRCHDF